MLTKEFISTRVFLGQFNTRVDEIRETLHLTSFLLQKQFVQLQGLHTHSEFDQIHGQRTHEQHHLERSLCWSLPDLSLVGFTAHGRVQSAERKSSEERNIRINTRGRRHKHVRPRN